MLMNITVETKYPIFEWQCNIIRRRYVTKLLFIFVTSVNFDVAQTANTRLNVKTKLIVLVPRV
jgi:hypothetical protein